MKRMRFVMAFCVLMSLSLAGPLPLHASDPGETVLQQKDDNVGRLLGTGSRLLPVFVAVRLASRMKPETVATVATSMPVERAVAICKGLDRDFLTEVTCHLNPVKGSPIIEKCPNDLVVDVIKRLVKSNKAAVAGRIADHLTLSKLVVLSRGLTPLENVQIGVTMAQKTLIAKVMAANPDSYIGAMLNECIRLSYYQLVADVVQELDAARNMRVLDGMNMNSRNKTLFLAKLTKHLSPTKSGEVIQECPDRVVADVVIQMIKDGDTAVLGGFSDHLPREKLVSVSNFLTTDQKAQVGYTMKNRQLIAGVLAEYSDRVVADLLNATAKLGYYDLIADMVEAMNADRNIRILNAMSLDREGKTRFLAKLAKKLTPLRSADIIEKCPNQTVADVAESLIKEGNANVVGGFCDRLSRKKIGSVSRLLDKGVKIQVAKAMKKRQVIAEVLAACPDSEVVELLNEAIRLEADDLVADIAGAMKQDRIRRVITLMDDVDFKRLMAHYDPEKFRQVVGAMDRNSAREFARTLNNTKVAAMADQPQAEVFNILWPHFGDSRKLEILALMDMKKLPAAWPGFDAKVRSSLMALGSRNAQLAEALKKLPAQ